MSATAQNLHEELKPAIPMFSYAQAAKGKAASSQITASVGKAVASVENKESNKKGGSDSERIPTGVAENQTKTLENGNEGQQVASDEVNSVVEQNSTNGSDSVAIPKLNPSEPSSRSSGTSTQSVGQTETNGSSTASALHEKNKDEQTTHLAQNSNGVEKEVSEQSTEPSWGDEKATTMALKEAPPPPVNVWAQRMAQTPSRQAVSHTATASGPRTTPLENGSTSGFAKAPESNHESRQHENRRKSRVAPQERQSSRENGRIGDSKGKVTDAAIKTVPHSMAPPPPPGDAVSWPTPDNAIEDDRKKSQERPEKEKALAAKPHGRKEWQQMPFVPTVAFNTPLPQARRGGRPAGGTRDGGRGRNGAAAEKSTSTGASPTGQTPAVMEERPKASAGLIGANTGSQKAKRASSAGPTTLREQRKQGETAGLEKRKDSEILQSKGAPAKNVAQPELRRQSATTVGENQVGKANTGRPPIKETLIPPKKAPSHSGEEDRQPQSTIATAPPFRPSENNGRIDAAVKNVDTPREPQPSFPVRERTEGRPDRGRGGFRGRGGGNQNMHNGFTPNGHAYSPNYTQYQPTPSAQGRSFSNHERLGSQQPGSFYPPGSTNNRHHRSSSRSQSIPHPYGRFSHASHTGPPHLAALQTDLANNMGFQPEFQGPMSAIPFNPYIQGPNLFGMVTVQMEYYFSVDNLCKDTYLRSNMNSQGFVPLALVAGFRRIQSLTPDLELVRYVCLNSPTIEVRVAEDGSDWIRRREEWQQWVLNIEERAPSARNDGPAPTGAFTQPQVYGSPSHFDEQQAMSPPSAVPSAPLESLQFQVLDNTTPTTIQTATTPAPAQNGASEQSQVPLSATVSEFTPSVRSSGNRVFSSPDPHSHGTNIISDEEMEKLNITFRARPADLSATVPPAFHSAASRTFSNGSIDGSAISSELSKIAEQQTNPNLNGDVPESIDHPAINRSRSPFSVGSPHRKAAALNSAPPVLWFKDKEHLTRMNSLPSEYTHASYMVFRQNALGQRERVTNESCVYDMQVLYNFWAHYLIRNFNATTYNEFKRLAEEDEAQRSSNFGLLNLRQYYDEALLGQRLIPNDAVAHDFIDFVKKESSDSDRPIFKRLRAAWRNGAFNPKNRAKLVKIIDSDLKADLDR